MAQKHMIGVAYYSGVTSNATDPSKTNHAQINTSEGHWIHYGNSFMYLAEVDSDPGYTGTGEKTVTIGGTNAENVDIGRDGYMTTIKGDLTVDGTRFIDQSEIVLINDNYLNLNAGYVDEAAQSAGLVFNVDPDYANRKQTAASNAFDGDNDRIVLLADYSSTFPAGTIFVVTGTTLNDGIYESNGVTGTDPYYLNIKTAPDQAFSQNSITTEDIQVYITPVDVGALKVSDGSGSETLGTFYVAYGGDASSFGWAEISADADWTISGSDQYSAVAGNVGIGETVPTSKLHVKSSAVEVGHLVNSGASGPASGSFVLLTNDDGAALADGDRFAGIAFRGAYDASHNTYGAVTLEAYAEGAWSGTSTPASLMFRTTPSGSITRQDRMIITDGGNVGIGNFIPDDKLVVNGGIRLGNTTNAVAGNMRWTGSAFQGYTGSAWEPFGGVQRVGATTDNALVRWNGTAAEIQTSAFDITDGNSIEKRNVGGTSHMYIKNLNSAGNLDLSVVSGRVYAYASGGSLTVSSACSFIGNTGMTLQANNGTFSMAASNGPFSLSSVNSYGALLSYSTLQLWSSNGTVSVVAGSSGGSNTHVYIDGNYGNVQIRSGAAETPATSTKNIYIETGSNTGTNSASEVFMSTTCLNLLQKGGYWYDDTAKRVFEIHYQTIGAPTFSRISDTAGNASGLICRRARGTSSIVKVVDGDSLGFLNIQGWQGTAYSQCASVNAYVDGWDGTSGTEIDSSLRFSTNDGSGLGERMRISPAGNVGVGVTSSLTEKLHLNGGVVVATASGSRPAGTIQWDGSNFQGYTGTGWVDLDASGGATTLDEAYEGGATINVDSGTPVFLNAGTGSPPFVALQLDDDLSIQYGTTSVTTLYSTSAHTFSTTATASATPTAFVMTSGAGTGVAGANFTLTAGLGGNAATGQSGGHFYAYGGIGGNATSAGNYGGYGGNVYIAGQSGGTSIDSFGGGGGNINLTGGNSGLSGGTTYNNSGGSITLTTGDGYYPGHITLDCGTALHSSPYPGEVRIQPNEPGTIKIGNATSNPPTTFLGSGMVSVDSYVALAELSSAPGTTANYGKVYCKTDNKLYYKDDGGTEYDLTVGTLDDAYDYGGAGSGRTITADSGAVQVNATNNGGIVVNQNDNLGYPLTLQLSSTGTAYAHAYYYFASGAYTGNPDGLVIDYTTMTSWSSTLDIAAINLKGIAGGSSGKCYGLYVEGQFDWGARFQSDVRIDDSTYLYFGNSPTDDSFIYYNPAGFGVLNMETQELTSGTNNRTPLINIKSGNRTTTGTGYTGFVTVGSGDVDNVSGGAGSSGSVRMWSGDGYYAGQSSGTVNIYTGGAFETGQSERIYFETGWVYDGYSTGTIYIRTGDNDDDGIGSSGGYSGSIIMGTGTVYRASSGEMNLYTGNVYSSSSSYSSGRIYIYSGYNYGGGYTGLVDISTGVPSSSYSGLINVHTGNSTTTYSGHLNLYTGTGNTYTGNVNLYTGNASTSSSGLVSIHSGNSTTIGSGGVFIYTGTTTSSTSGSVTIYTGNSSSSTSGNIYLYAGTGTSKGFVEVQDTYFKVFQASSVTACGHFRIEGTSTAYPAVRIDWATSTYTSSPTGLLVDYTTMSSLNSSNDVAGINLKGRTNAGSGDCYGLYVENQFDYGARFQSTVRMDDNTPILFGNSPTSDGIMYFNAAGFLSIGTLDNSGSPSPYINFVTGQATSANSGDLNIRTGNTVTTGNSGDINLTTGTIGGTGTRGDVVLAGRNIIGEAFGGYLSLLADTTSLIQVDGATTNQQLQIVTTGSAGKILLETSGSAAEIEAHTQTADANITLNADLAAVYINSYTNAIWQTIGKSSGTSADVTVQSGDCTSTGNSGAVILETGDVSGTGTTGNVYLRSGESPSTGGVTGNAYVKSGNSLSSTARTGTVYVESGAQNHASQTAYASGDLYVRSGTTNAAASGFVWVASGTSTSNTTGAVWVSSGVSSATTGQVIVKSGSRSVSGSYNTGPCFIGSGDNQGNWDSGGVTLESGTADDYTGDVVVRSGASDDSRSPGSAYTGEIHIYTGSLSSAYTGLINIYTGFCNSGGSSSVTGNVNIQTGNNLDGVTGDVTIQSGNTYGSGNTGDVTIQAGTPYSTGTPGDVYIQGGNEIYEGGFNVTSPAVSRITLGAAGSTVRLGYGGAISSSSLSGQGWGRGSIYIDSTNGIVYRNTGTATTTNWVSM